jgi:hypothetical protein
MGRLIMLAGIFLPLPILAGIGEQMGSPSGGNFIQGFFVLLVAEVGYFLPTLIALFREAPNTGSVFVLNLLLGWTVIVWIIALAMAVRSKPAVAAAVQAPARAPVISPDGQFWWDGQRWQPLAGAQKPDPGLPDPARPNSVT